MTAIEQSRTQPGSPDVAEAKGAPKRTAWTALTAAFGAVSGVAPHVLHHVGPLVGAAMLAGVAGTVVFGAIGLGASIPFLLRLHHRFHTWWAPGIALVFFTTTFLFSSLWLGPLISRQPG